jgi:hypothetical protein
MEGATANLVRNTGIGAVFDPSDIAGIKGFLGQFLEECGSSGCWLELEAANQFDHYSISRRLADELGRLWIMAPAPEAAS